MGSGILACWDAGPNFAKRRLRTRIHLPRRQNVKFIRHHPGHFTVQRHPVVLLSFVFISTPECSSWILLESRLNGHRTMTLLA